MTAGPHPPIEDLRAALAALDRSQAPAVWLARLVQHGVDRLPLPGAGSTLQRWQALCAVAEHDLSLAKLYEGHTDALAVMAEVSPTATPVAGATWGMWAAEAPDGRTVLQGDASGGARLSGTKRWCSGAGQLSHGLLTAFSPQGHGPQLVRVAMNQPGVNVCKAGWHAVGMAGTASGDVQFDGARAIALGEPRAYTERPGFMHGAAGVAACWYGGAAGIARHLHRLARRRQDDAFVQAHLGAVDVALAQAAIAVAVAKMAGAVREALRCQV